MGAPKRTKRIPRAEQQRELADAVFVEDHASHGEFGEPLRNDVSTFKQELRTWNEGTGTDALGAFEALVRAGCSDEGLIGRVVALRAAQEFEAKVHGDAPRMNSRELRSLVERTYSVAREWEREFQSPFGKMVLERAARCDVFCKKAQYRNVPQMLRSLAAEAKTIHRGSSRRRRPLYDDNLAELMEYVKLKTERYHDPRVSALVWFATGKECDTNTLAVWRNEHPRPLERAHRHLRPPAP